MSIRELACVYTLARDVYIQRDMKTTKTATECFRSLNTKGFDLAHISIALTALGFTAAEIIRAKDKVWHGR